MKTDDDFRDTPEFKRLRASLDRALKAAMHELRGQGRDAIPPFIALTLASYSGLTGTPITSAVAEVMACYELNFGD
jgi:hypothetical protein